MSNQRIKDIESGKVPLVSMHKNGTLLPSAAKIVRERFSKAHTALEPELEKIRESRCIPSDLMKRKYY